MVLVVWLLQVLVVRLLHALVVHRRLWPHVCDVRRAACRSGRYSMAEEIEAVRTCSLRRRPWSRGRTRHASDFVSASTTHCHMVHRWVPP